MAGAVLTSIPALADGVIKGFYDAPNNASLAGQKWAQASFLSGHDAAIGYLEGTQYFMTGFLGVGDVATLGSSSAIRPGVPAPMVAAHGGGQLLQTPAEVSERSASTPLFLKLIVFLLEHPEVK